MQTLHRTLTTLLIAMSPMYVPDSGAAAVPAKDAWYKVEFSGVTVGLGHDHWAKRNSKHYYESYLEIRASRLGESMQMMSRWEEYDDDAGRTVRFRTDASVTGTAMVTTGEMRDDTLVVTTEGADFKHDQLIPWRDGAIGQGVVDQHIVRMIQAGHHDFEVLVFDPTVLDFRTSRYVVNTEAPETAVGMWVVDQFDDGSVVPTITYWLDEKFNADKMIMRQMGIDIVVQRITREAFENLELDPNFDIIRQSMIPCANYDLAPHKVDAVTFTLDFADAGSNAWVVDAPNQKVVQTEGSSIDLVVGRHPIASEKSTKAELETYLKPDRFIQSDHPTIKSIADSLLAKGESGFDLAETMARWVNEHIDQKGYGEGFATAVDVCASQSGDCTEHAVLLAALLRAAGIPARIAVGLLYHDGFLIGHMWTEAYAGYWQTFDALDANADPIRIRVSVSPDERALSELALISAYSTIGDLKVVVKDQTPRRKVAP